MGFAAGHPRSQHAAAGYHKQPGGEGGRGEELAPLLILLRQAVHVHDVVAHLGVINGALRGAFPGPVRLSVVREYADELEGEIADDLWVLPKYQEMLFIK